MLHPNQNQPYQQQPYWNQNQGWQPHPPVPQPTVLPVKTNHALHLVLSLVTCGMWLPVWAVVAMVNSGRTRKVY
ncbi:hypothetical protein ST20ES_35 [Mycobacterium phage 20ES]|uniref:hypothetical protein n=1 Tax=Mycobacterium phage 20ES TaxID=1458726 RepID=UPI0003F1E460|nr:hypothetical protein ST20ES_35 [Mycobacterium phage 20ES]AHJ86488.1 hypothetical protein 20ES_35 [Mycobacterium phage 20ES]